jgi:hypothetical protein
MLAKGGTSAPEGAIVAAFMVRLKPYPSRLCCFANPKDVVFVLPVTRGLKPEGFLGLLRGPEGPLFHGAVRS